MSYTPPSSQNLDSNGIKRLSRERHRTPFSDGCYAMTSGQFTSFGITDCDGFAGIYDNSIVHLSALLELKAAFFDRNGHPLEQNPPQEALWCYLARVLGLSFVKVRDMTQAPLGRFADIAAAEYDTNTGTMRTRFRTTGQWKAHVTRVTAALRQTGTPFTLITPTPQASNATEPTRIWLVYGSDNRHKNNWVAPVRCFFVVAVIVEIHDEDIVDVTQSLELRVCAALIKALTVTQCFAPVLTSVFIAASPEPTDTESTDTEPTPVTPWQWQRRDVCTGTVQETCDLPVLPIDPANHRTHPAVRAWQAMWNDKLDLNRTFALLRAQTVQRGLRDDGEPFCMACLRGQCGSQATHDVRNHGAALTLAAATL